VPPGPGRESLHRLAQAGFRQRRKQLHNALGRELPLSAGELADAFDGCGIDPERRAQTLSVAEWACLADRLHDRLA
jgi:16S rRNA (adenine1518-N6/adenine1519-N6)-dimethyltransferase